MACRVARRSRTFSKRQLTTWKTGFTERGGEEERHRQREREKPGALRKGGNPPSRHAILAQLPGNTLKRGTSISVVISRARSSRCPSSFARDRRERRGDLFFFPYATRVLCTHAHVYICICVCMYVYICMSNHKPVGRAAVFLP